MMPIPIATSCGIPDLPGFEVTSNAKVNQVEMPILCPHDVGWFQVAEDNGRLLGVQVLEYLS